MRFYGKSYIIVTQTEVYRSGHNEAVLKTVWVHAHGGSNPSTSAKQQSLPVVRAGSAAFSVCQRDSNESDARRAEKRFGEPFLAADRRFFQSIGNFNSSALKKSRANPSTSANKNVNSSHIIFVIESFFIKYCTFAVYKNRNKRHLL